MVSDQALNRRSFLKYSGAAAAATALAGCSDDEPVDTEDPGNGNGNGNGNGTGNGDGNGDGDEPFGVTITQGTFPTTLDPVDHLDTPTFNVQDQAYDPFLYRDHDGGLIASIVTDWERTADTTVELTVREGVQFHSGSTLTAEDVAYSINRSNNPDVSNQAGVIGNIDEATALDDTTVEVELGGIEPVVFRNLSAFGRVMEREWTEAREQGEIAEEMNGTGPYQLVEFEDGNRVIYEKFDDYWGDEPDVDEVTFNAVADEGTRVDRLIAGESDLIVNVNPRDVGELRDSDEANTEFVPSIRSIFLVMNNVKEPFDSEAFRQAMNHAVDVDAIINSLLNEFGDRTSQPTLPDHFGHNPDVDPYEHDPGRAEDLVAESGYEDVEITLETTTGRYLRDTDIAETAAGQINELSNVSCEAELRDTSSLFAETADGSMETSPAFYLIGWGNPTFDANYTMAPWFVEGQVFQHFRDDDISGRIAETNQMTDVGEREAALQELNADIHDTAAWVFLHQQYSIYGTSNRIDWSARSDEDINVREISQA